VIINKSYEQAEEVDELLNYAEQKIFEISGKRIKKEFVEINPLVKSAFARIDELQKFTSSGITGVATGYKKLDELTAGLQPSDLVSPILPGTAITSRL